MYDRTRRAPSVSTADATVAPELPQDMQGLYGNSFAQDAMGLPSDLMRQFERSLGTDLSDVRLHTGEDAATRTAAVHADAYTLGNDILFGEDTADFSSPEGVALLAHEVAHTVQQRDSAPFVQRQESGAAATATAEKEANRSADDMIRGVPVARPIDEVSPYTGQPVVTTPQRPGEIDVANPYATAPRLTKPTMVPSTLGPMAVYPDDHEGPLPKGAVKQSEHEHMVDLIQKIETGQSQVSIDTSSFTAGLDPAKDPAAWKKAQADADAFRKQHLGYLKDLVKTPTGLTMLNELGTSDHTTTITHGNRNNCESKDPEAALLQADGTHPDGSKKMKPGAGSDVTVMVNPNDKTYYDPKHKRHIGEVEEPWMRERQKYGFYHELVHAYHDTQGESMDGYFRGTTKAEPQAVGQAKTPAAKDYEAGTFPDEAVSDNAIRRDMGKAERPEY